MSWKPPNAFLLCRWSFKSVSQYLQFVYGEVLTDYYHQYPFARLRFAGTPKHFRIWDTPSPPQWEKCVIDTRYDYTRARGHLATIDTRTSSGLTFFVASGLVWAIHSHTRKEPSAQCTFSTLQSRQQSIVQWVHVPLCIKDTISTFGWSVDRFKARFYVSYSILSRLM